MMVRKIEASVLDKVGRTAAARVRLERRGLLLGLGACALLAPAAWGQQATPQDQEDEAQPPAPEEQAAPQEEEPDQGILGPLTAQVLIGQDAKSTWRGLLTSDFYALSSDGEPGRGRYFYYVPGSGSYSRATAVVVLGEKSTNPIGGAGLLFGTNTDGTRYFALIVHPGGTVKLYQRQGDQIQELGALGREQTQIPESGGEPVTLTVEAQEGGGVLRVGDLQVGRMDGDSFFQGGAGIIALSPGSFAFRHFEIE